MGALDRYIHSLTSSLKDDAHSHGTDPLAAAALADKSSRDIGSLLARVKYGNGLVRKEFESGSGNLASLLRIWGYYVAAKGAHRKWLRTEDIALAHALYKRVAESSLAHWLDGGCKVCGGTTYVQAPTGPINCKPCNGTGREAIGKMSAYEKKLVEDMVSEMESLLIMHGREADRLLSDK